jgi:ribonuclease HI
MNKLTINTDGGARGNPGPAAVGVVVMTEDGRLVTRLSKYLGVATNNQAEYQAVILALNYLQDNLDHFREIEQIDFVLDSELVVRQLLRVYRVKDLELLEIFNQVQSKRDNLPFEISFRHVKRAQNTAADKLVNEELDKSAKTE